MYRYQSALNSKSVRRRTYSIDVLQQHVLKEVKEILSVDALEEVAEDADLSECTTADVKDQQPEFAVLLSNTQRSPHLLLVL